MIIAVSQTDILNSHAMDQMTFFLKFDLCLTQYTGIDDLDLVDNSNVVVLGRDTSQFYN